MTDKQYREALRRTLSQAETDLASEHRRYMPEYRRLLLEIVALRQALKEAYENDRPFAP